MARRWGMRDPGARGQVLGARDASPGHPASESREGGTRVPALPVCNAARSFGTPGVGSARMPRWGGRGFRVPLSPGLARGCGMRGPSARGQAPSVRGMRCPAIRRPKPAKAGRASRPSPFAMLLDHLEPPGWEPPGRPAGVVGGSASASPLARPFAVGCRFRGLMRTDGGSCSTRGYLGDAAARARTWAALDGSFGPSVPVHALSVPPQTFSPDHAAARARRWDGCSSAG